MTRDEFMEEVQKEIDQIFLTPKSRLMNLVMIAWAEGKKNAEVSNIEDIVKETIEKIYNKPETGKRELHAWDWWKDHPMDGEIKLRGCDLRGADFDGLSDGPFEPKTESWTP